MKILFRIILISISLIYLLWGCQSPKASKDEYLILLPKSTSSLPLISAVDHGILDDVTFKYDFFSNHPQALAQLLRGDADFLLTGSTQGWENQKSGGPIIAVSSGVWGISYLMGKELIDSWSDLKSRKIVLPFIGAPLDYQTKALLSHVGLDPEIDVELSYSPFAVTIGLLVSGQADYAPLPEPLASRLELQGKLRRIFSYEESWGRLTKTDGAAPQVSLFVTKDFLSSDKVVVDALLTSWKKATDTVVENPEKIADQYAEILGFSVEEIIQSINNSHLELVSPQENKNRSFEYAAQLKEFFPDFDAGLKESFFYSSN